MKARRAPESNMFPCVIEGEEIRHCGPKISMLLIVMHASVAWAPGCGSGVGPSELGISDASKTPNMKDNDVTVAC